MVKFKFSALPQDGEDMERMRKGKETIKSLPVKKLRQSAQIKKNYVI